MTQISSYVDPYMGNSFTKHTEETAENFTPSEITETLVENDANDAPSIEEIADVIINDEAAKETEVKEEVSEEVSEEVKGEAVPEVKEEEPAKGTTFKAGKTKHFNKKK